MQFLRFWIAFTLVACACAQTSAPSAPIPPATETLHAVHNALFATFIPVDTGAQPSSPVPASLTPQFVAVRDALWTSASPSPYFRQLLAPFLDLRSFGATCGLADYLHADAPASLAALTFPQREHVLSLLATCDQNPPRQLAMSLRNFYISKTYTPLQEQIAGVELHRTATHEWIQQHLPILPPTRLRYDAANRSIVSTDHLPFDYLIVGSGPAGSVLAHQLRRHGRRVLLVERGSFLVPGALQTRIADDLLDERTTTDGGINIHNGMTVGGGSQVNVDLCFAPTSPAVLAKIESWRAQGRIGPNDFTPTQLTSAYLWVKAAIGTRTLSESEINTNNRVLWDGARVEGLHPSLYDLNTYAPGHSPYPVTDKRSSESELLLAALSDPVNPLSMLPDADVRRVLFDTSGGKPKAIGVEIRTRTPLAAAGVISDPNHLNIPAATTLTIRARTVILSAGALGSPTILLRSGVANPLIGRGIILHPSMPILGSFDRTIDALNGTEASVYVADHLIDRRYALESMSAPPVYAAIMSPGPPQHAYDMIHTFRHLAGFGVMLVDTPSPDNRVTLDASGEPLIAYHLSIADEQRFREGIAEAIRVMFRGGAQEVFLPTTENVLDFPPNQRPPMQPVVLTHIEQADAVAEHFHFIPNQTILTSAHMQATDKMGATAATSVVGRDFHVWGTQNLYVVDGSVFPTSIGANPMQSIYTFAKIFADKMNQQPQAGH
ncbi:MAG: GMC family oxidoreductase [Acidobacteriaceae bacterium]